MVHHTSILHEFWSFWNLGNNGNSVMTLVPTRNFCLSRRGEAPDQVTRLFNHTLPTHSQEQLMPVTQSLRSTITVIGPRISTSLYKNWDWLFCCCANHVEWYNNQQITKRRRKCSVFAEGFWWSLFDIYRSHWTRQEQSRSIRKSSGMSVTFEKVYAYPSPPWLCLHCRYRFSEAREDCSKVRQCRIIELSR